MGWLKEKKEERMKRAMYARVNDKHIAYATMRCPDGTEKVIGKNGSINITADEVLLRVGDRYAFRGALATTRIGELMSLNGVTVQGLDLESGEKKSVVGYYEYHRK